MSRRDNTHEEARIGLHANANNAVQNLIPELENVCPPAHEALKECLVYLRKRHPWNTIRYIGEASGALQAYILSAQIDVRRGESDGPLQIYQALRERVLVAHSTVVSLFEMEWERT